MADNVLVDNNALTDYPVATDDDGTAQHQYVKVEFGADNTQTKVTSAVGLPVKPIEETAGVGVGAAADAEAAGSGSVIAILKRLRTLLGVSSTTGLPPSAGQSAATTATWTSATAVDTAVTLTTSNAAVAVVSFNPTGSITSGQLNFEVSDNGGSTYHVIRGARIATVGVDTVLDLNAATKQAWRFNVAGMTHFRVRLNPVIGGTGSAAISAQSTAAAALSFASSTLVDSAGAALSFAPDHVLAASPMSVRLGDGTNFTDIANIAHDAVDVGNPVKVGAKALAAPSAMTTVADADRTNLFSDLDGLQMVKPWTSASDLQFVRVADTSGTSTAFGVASSVFGAWGTGIRNYITTVTIYNSSSTDGYVDLRDGAAGAIMWTCPAPALGGSSITFPTPLRQTSSNTALAYDVSGALTTVYISVAGFKSKL